MNSAIVRMALPLALLLYAGQVQGWEAAGGFVATGSGPVVATASGAVGCACGALVALLPGVAVALTTTVAVGEPLSQPVIAIGATIASASVPASAILRVKIKRGFPFSFDGYVGFWERENRDT